MLSTRDAKTAGTRWSIESGMLISYNKKREHYDNPTNVRLYGDGEWDLLIRWLCFSGRPTTRGSSNR